MFDYLEILSPATDSGDVDNYDQCIKFKKDFLSLYPDLKCNLIIKSHSHDFGIYYSIQAVFEEEVMEQVNDAFKCEGEYLDNFLKKYPKWKIGIPNA